MSAVASGGIGDSAAWKLIDGLRQSSHRFGFRPAASLRAGAGAGSTRLHELRTALGHLDLQIRTTFTILQLQLLLHLEEELPDDASESSFDSDSESGDESSSRGSDQDDRSSASSGSSIGSRGLAPRQLRTDMANPSAPPSSSQALSLLQNLCSHLEARVNPALVPVQPRPLGKATSYPMLERLLRHIKSLPSSIERLELLPTPGSAPTPFLFNVSAAADMAAAFVALRDPEPVRPHKKIRQKMLAEVEFMRSVFLEFNSFVNNLQISIGSVDSLAERPGQSLVSSRSFASFASLQKFQRQASAAFRAIFSQFRLCPRRDLKEHKIFLRLPEWEDVSDCRSADVTRDLPVQLFFTSCLCSGWQPADAYLLIPEDDECKTQRLCKAISSAYNDDRDLKFYVSETPAATHSGDIPVHVPKDPEPGRRQHDSFKFPAASLWSLVKSDYFARKPTMELIRRASGNAAVFGIDQRKAFAVKLVLGLMLSMDSDRIIGTWNPKHIHSFKPHEKEFPIFVSIDEDKDSSSGLEGLSLARWEISRDYGLDDDDLKPLPPFTLLAKALLQIASGEPLRSLKIACHSERAFRDGWKSHRKLVDDYLELVTSGDSIDLEVVPFLRAARSCLYFHTLYQKHARTARSSSRMEIAWRLVFTDILSQIDSSLTLGGLVQPGMGDITERDPVPLAGEAVVEESSVVTIVHSAKAPTVTTVVYETLEEMLPIPKIRPLTAQHEVALFDGEDATEESIDVERAEVFFELLDQFHDSYSLFVAARDAKSGAESPRRIRVAILDTGIDFGHPGLGEAITEGRVRREWCRSWVGDENDCKDEDDGLHGTNCAYILHKVAPEADIYIAKVFENTSFRTYQARHIAKAIDHAVETWNVDIISMSFGLRPPAPQVGATPAEMRDAREEFEKIVDSIKEAIRKASPRIMFAAASNNGKNEKRAFPARYDPRVICVHASDGKGNDGGINPPTEGGANFMTLGMGLSLMERHWSFRGKTRQAGYKTVYKSGTSFATPIAAGIAATVLDLAARVAHIEERTRREMKECTEMRKVLRLMSTPKQDVVGQCCFLAPWNHWENNWHGNETKCRLVWDLINDLFQTS